MDHLPMKRQQNDFIAPVDKDGVFDMLITNNIDPSNTHIDTNTDMYKLIKKRMESGEIRVMPDSIYIDDTLMVQKSEDILDAQYEANRAKLLVMAAISAIADSNDKISQEYHINVPALAQVYNKSRRMRTDIWQAIVDLYRQDITIAFTKGPAAVKMTRTLTSLVVVPVKGIAVVTVGQDFFPHIIKNNFNLLKTKYRDYKLLLYKDLKTTEPIRLYEYFIKMLEDDEVMNLECEVEFIRALLLGADSTKYKSFSMFRKNVLDVAIDKINAYSNISVSYKMDGAHGKKIKRFFFVIEQRLPKKKKIVASKQITASSTSEGAPDLKKTFLQMMLSEGIDVWRATTIDMQYDKEENHEIGIDIIMNIRKARVEEKREITAGYVAQALETPYRQFISDKYKKEEQVSLFVPATSASDKINEFLRVMETKVKRKISDPVTHSTMAKDLIYAIAEGHPDADEFSDMREMKADEIFRRIEQHPITRSRFYLFVAKRTLAREEWDYDYYESTL